MLGKIKNRAHCCQAKYIDFPFTCENFIIIYSTTVFQEISMLKRAQFSSKDRSTTKNKGQEIEFYSEEE